MPPLLQRWRFTVDDYHRMGRVGIIGPDARVELIDGEVMQMAPIGSHHAFCVNNLNELFSRQAPGRYIVSVQNPVRLTRHSEPQPDILILRPHAHRYVDSLPSAADVFLVIEVADTTLSYDRRTKLALYAEAGIPEASLVNIPRRTIEVHREPCEGRYQQVSVHHKGERIAPLAFPDISIAGEAVLP